MTHKLKTFIAAAAATTLIAGSASALTAVTQGDFKLHSGAAPQSATTGTVASGTEVLVNGCWEDGIMCQVTYDGKTGWAPSNQLGVNVDGETVLLSSNPQTVTVKQITVPSDTANKDAQGAGAMAGAVAGGAAGAAVGGPVGGVVGALIGAAGIGAAAKPEPSTVTWVEKHPVAPVYLSGDLKTGVQIPPGVDLTPVPESKYAYINVNDQPVLVDPDSRAVVYIIPGK